MSQRFIPRYLAHGEDPLEAADDEVFDRQRLRLKQRFFFLLPIPSIVHVNKRLPCGSSKRMQERRTTAT